MPLYLPAQGASEIEATIIEWHVAEGDRFTKGQSLVQIDSAKSVYDFEAPCDGLVIRRLHLEGETLPLAEPIVEIETEDPAMRDWIPPAAAAEHSGACIESAPAVLPASRMGTAVGFLGFGGYLPERVVTNEELVAEFPEITAEYIYQVTGIRQRRWAADDEKPSAMAYQAALEAIRKASVAAKDIDALVVATTTPDFAMPSTAAILQDRLNLQTIPGFDLNAACSGWLYAVSAAKGLILSGIARNVLTVGVDMQSRLLDKSDRSAYFLFGDGAGAAIVSALPEGAPGHRIHQVVLGSDTRGLHMARRCEPGYAIRNGQAGIDPWIRIDGPALFRCATESFTNIIGQAISRSGWTIEQTRWIIPHQANGRILKAAAKRSGVGFDRFYLNVDHVGNTSSASIPIAICEMEDGLQSGDKLVLCSVGAGMTTAAISVEW
ncbi:MAG: beta-ketoacyl-ACP synthase 3 [Planctomycetaceae bacterium]|nr:beta-ketoacyl-ACP synthase 3 [Planctomycetaceae bacterium]